MLTLINIFSHSWIMVLLLLIFGAAVIADLFKRRLLSKPIVYEATMILSPFAALTAVGTPIAAVFTKGIAAAALTFLFGAVLMILAAAVYIRGHIVPADKSAGRFTASKRLIYLGAAGTAVYGVIMIIQLVECLTVIGSMGDTVIGSVHTLFVLLILLFVPIFNIISFVILFVLGAEIAAVGIAAFLVLLMSLLTANGCIRYIITANMTKGQKVLRIFLSLIPIVNIVIGIGYCRHMKE